MTDRPTDHRATGSAPLPARHAECVVWLARYMERIENLARILDVTKTFARSSDDEAWLSLVRINADEERFLRRHATATGQNVACFYVIDRDNPSSIVSQLSYARENARTLRALISTEMWSQINVFYATVRALTEEDIEPAHLSRLCATLKESCQTHAGITQGTFYRDQSWSFYMIGKYLERADQMTRLVDIKYHTLLPPMEKVGSAIDVSQWNAVLRAAAGYQAFRRVHSGGLSPASVAGFLLLNAGFPRSVVLGVLQIEWHLTHLRSRFGLHGGASALERLDTLRAMLTEQSIEQIIARGLHEFLDWTQRQLQLLYIDIADAFFPRATE